MRWNKMFFIKKFKFTMERGLELINKDDLISYVEQKIQYFSQYENYSNKEEKLKLLDEIIKMCDYDKNSAIFDYAELPSIEGFNIVDLEIQMIYYYNLVYILGGIFLNVFDKEKNVISHVSEGVNGIISTSSMFLSAYDELIKCKKNNLKPAYGATLILVTLFEKDLKEHTKRIYAKKYLIDLKTNLDAGKIILTADENKLFEYLQFQYGITQNRTTDSCFNPVMACSQMQYKLLQKYIIIPKKYKNFEDLLFDRITLNKLLHSKEFKDIADDRFVSFVTLLFETKKVNLRNNLAHCNTTYSNYYSIHITALLFVLFTMVSDGSFLK